MLQLLSSTKYLVVDVQLNVYMVSTVTPRWLNTPDPISAGKLAACNHIRIIVTVLSFRTLNLLVASLINTLN